MCILSYLVRKINEICCVDYVSVRILGFKLGFLLILLYWKLIKNKIIYVSVYIVLFSKKNR
jgi:hypothetical protein